MSAPVQAHAASGAIVVPPRAGASSFLTDSQLTPEELCRMLEKVYKGRDSDSTDFTKRALGNPATRNALIDLLLTEKFPSLARERAKEPKLDLVRACIGRLAADEAIPFLLELVGQSVKEGKPIHSGWLLTLNGAAQDTFLTAVIEKGWMDRIFDVHFGLSQDGWMSDESKNRHSVILLKQLLGFDLGRKFLQQKIDSYHEGESSSIFFYLDLTEANSLSDKPLDLEDPLYYAVEYIEEPSLNRLRLLASMGPPPSDLPLFPQDATLSNAHRALIDIAKSEEWPRGGRDVEIESRFTRNLVQWILVASAHEELPVETALGKLEAKEIQSLVNAFTIVYFMRSLPGKDPDQVKTIAEGMFFLLDIFLHGQTESAYDRALFAAGEELRKSHLAATIKDCSQPILERFKDFPLSPEGLGKLMQEDEHAFRLITTLRRLVTLIMPRSPGIFANAFIDSTTPEERLPYIRAMALAAHTADSRPQGLANLLCRLPLPEFQQLLSDPQFAPLLKNKVFFDAIHEVYYYVLDQTGDYAHMPIAQRREVFNTFVKQFPLDFREALSKYLAEKHHSDSNTAVRV